MMNFAFTRKLWLRTALKRFFVKIFVKFLANLSIEPTSESCVFALKRVLRKLDFYEFFSASSERTRYLENFCTFFD